MNAYMGSSCIAPLVLSLATAWRCVVNIALLPLYPWQRTTVHVECLDGHRGVCGGFGEEKNVIR
jgi:hypothetical protein